MGMHKYTYLVAGVRLSEDDLKSLGFEGYCDDRLLPYIEGHEGTSVSLLGGEDFDGYVAGLWLADGGDECAEDVYVEVDADAIQQARHDLTAAGLLPPGRQVRLIFVDLWS